MTGLYNKATIQTMIQRILQERRGSGGQCALLVIDLDNFKQVNDRYGHLQGDKLLQEIGHILHASFQQKGLVGRIGGDEFVLFLGEIPSEQWVLEQTDALCRMLNIAYEAAEDHVPVSASIGVGLAPAFKMRFWNIGAEGQVLAGGLAAAACMICLGDKLPNGLLIVLIVIAGILAGAVWAVIPAIFKAKWNTNETLFTLMMNYVATQLVAYFIIVWESPKGSGKVGIINQSTEAGWLPQIGGYKYLLTILVVAVLTVLVYVYLNYSKHGYELSVVGESERTARYVGIKVGKVIVRTMLLSGALCGIAGVLLVSGTDHTITTTIAGGQGFTAVMVSWLAKFNPLGMILTSFLLVFLDRGAGEISTAFGLNQSFADILSGIIIFFIIGCEFFPSPTG